MRIVIDMQGAQGQNRARGIGRYTCSLVEAMVRAVKGHDIVLALNGASGESVDELRHRFEPLLGRAKIHCWYSVQPTASVDPGNESRNACAEELYEGFIHSLAPDFLLITSLFEGFADEGVTGVKRLVHRIPVGVILYDLIPFIHRSPYLDNPAMARWYDEKIAQLKHADLLLAISESSRGEALKYLGSNSESVFNISSAVGSDFNPQVIDPNVEQDIRAKFGLADRFVMYTGGIDHRKNIETLITAYAQVIKTVESPPPLVVVCHLGESDRSRLETQGRKQGLGERELVLTGFVSDDELLALYKLATLFVFPSWHEGFGLPVLEAMSCGCPVLVSDRSSLPEVVGREDLLFDPFSPESIAEKITELLANESKRRELAQYSLKRAACFSWSASAEKALAAIENCVESSPAPVLFAPSTKRPKLAFVSPLPPERSGISHYSAELLPELTAYFDIDVVVDQAGVSDPWICANCRVVDPQWLRDHASDYQAVLYHFGNSVFHQHMFELLEEVPGVVVLHDFYLSGVLAHREWLLSDDRPWSNALLASHGYPALAERYSAEDPAQTIWDYPANLPVLQNALGVVVHSEESLRLAQRWYGPEAASDWDLIPLLRTPAAAGREDRARARAQLGLSPGDFVVCSFGFLGMTKLNHELVKAWSCSELSKDPGARLIFVGDNDKGAYGRELEKLIDQAPIAANILITGWADEHQYNNYLQAADVGVQLRSLSRGETSASVLDCMNHGLATLVNANGSMADLPANAVYRLPDRFTVEQLASKLDEIYLAQQQRVETGERSAQHIRHHHNPKRCASLYAAAIERASRKRCGDPVQVIRQLRQSSHLSTLSKAGRLHLAECIDQTFPVRFDLKQLLVDVSELIKHDAGTGIQRVVRNILREWLNTPPEGYRIEPVYATESGDGYRYAARFSLEFLGAPSSSVTDDPVNVRPGDHFVGLDLAPKVVVANDDYYREMRRRGAFVTFIVYDLLCITHSDCFLPGAEAAFSRWLRVVQEADQAITISRAVKESLFAWLEQQADRGPSLDWFHLGVDEQGEFLPLKDRDESVVNALPEGEASFLMVGTIEPRKGHEEVLDAFEQLWKQNRNISLVIVGKQGWMVEQLARRLRNHSERGVRLFWLEGTTDTELEELYSTCDCLIANSRDEGFGLPIIEAARHGLPIMARDIAVFREVAGDGAFYFHTTAGSPLQDSIILWLEAYKDGTYPKPGSIRWNSWKESADQLLTKIMC
ncbi:glycosyltransferase [Marinobacterium litorale]|uniref:glycosyltransferase n=1 Tax=Marinobacterium litorale TaxID=404770 RepID=UPI000401740E|nr:glycosyltransferase [Marinobacterium litorale]